MTDDSDSEGRLMEGGLYEEEDALISAHRKHLEDTMEAVRKEMQLLAEVDQPGSAVESYVERLGRILEFKARSLLEMQERLCSYRARLSEEAEFNKAVGPGQGGFQFKAHAGVAHVGR